MPIQSNPRTWTLRFKNNRSTILLHIDPLQSLSSVKAELLVAVQQTNPDGTFNAHAIPQNADDIELAKPIDINDLSKGWESLEPKDDLLQEDAVDSKGKAKLGSKKADGKNSLKDCMQGAGLRDGRVVAFRFGKAVEEPPPPYKAEGDFIVDVDMESKKDEWDVVVPTVEETYGDGQQLVDEGVEDVR